MLHVLVPYCTREILGFACRREGHSVAPSPPSVVCAQDSTHTTRRRTRGPRHYTRTAKRKVMDNDLATLQAALDAAVNRSMPLPMSQKPFFIGRCLQAAHEGQELPALLWRKVRGRRS